MGRSRETCGIPKVGFAGNLSLWNMGLEKYRLK